VEASKRPTDVNEVAHLLVERSTRDVAPISKPEPPSQSDISRVMSELGKRGGRIGGKRRAESMTKEKRIEIALKGFPEGNQVLYAPEPIRDASGHGRGHAKCTMNFDEVVALWEAYEQRRAERAA
jgi:hypothetical protein